MAHSKIVETIEELCYLAQCVAETAKARYKMLEVRDRYLRLTTERTTDIRKAQNIVGTCPDMCPEKERYLLEWKCMVPFYERLPGSNQIDHKKAIKPYSRSSADQELPLPHELRTVNALGSTMYYLLSNHADRVDDPCARIGSVNISEWFHYIWDRTRSIRKDITQQDLCSLTVVELVQQCTRFHIYCAARMIEEDPSVFDQKINTENLTKCLQTLKYMYADLKQQGIKCPDEAEFRGYMILLYLNEGNYLSELSQLSEEIIRSEDVKFAMDVHLELMRNNYVRFFNMVRDASYLTACMLLRYFTQVRLKALETIQKAYAQRSTASFKLRYLMEILAFDDITEAEGFFNHFGVAMDRRKGLVLIEPRQSAHYFQKEHPYTPRRSINLVESKRDCSVGDAICGGSLRQWGAQFPPVPYVNSFDERGLFKEHLLDEICGTLDAHVVNFHRTNQNMSTDTDIQTEQLQSGTELSPTINHGDQTNDDFTSSTLPSTAEAAYSDGEETLFLQQNETQPPAAGVQMQSGLQYGAAFSFASVFAGDPNNIVLPYDHLHQEHEEQQPVPMETDDIPDESAGQLELGEPEVSQEQEEQGELEEQEEQEVQEVQEVLEEQEEQNEQQVPEEQQMPEEQQVQEEQEWQEVQEVQEVQEWQEWQEWQEEQEMQEMPEEQEEQEEQEVPTGQAMLSDSGDTSTDSVSKVEHQPLPAAGHCEGETNSIEHDIDVSDNASSASNSETGNEVRRLMKTIQVKRLKRLQQKYGMKWLNRARVIIDERATLNQKLASFRRGQGAQLPTLDRIRPILRARQEQAPVNISEVLANPVIQKRRMPVESFQSRSLIDPFSLLSKQIQAMYGMDFTLLRSMQPFYWKCLFSVPSTDDVSSGGCGFPSLISRWLQRCSFLRNEYQKLPGHTYFFFESRKSALFDCWACNTAICMRVLRGRAMRDENGHIPSRASCRHAQGIVFFVHHRMMLDEARERFANLLSVCGDSRPAVAVIVYKPDNNYSNLDDQQPENETVGSVLHNNWIDFMDRQTDELFLWEDGSSNMVLRQALMFLANEYCKHKKKITVAGTHLAMLPTSDFLDQCIGSDLWLRWHVVCRMTCEQGNPVFLHVGQDANRLVSLYNESRRRVIEMIKPNYLQRYRCVAPEFDAIRIEWKKELKTQLTTPPVLPEAFFPKAWHTAPNYRIDELLEVLRLYTLEQPLLDAVMRVALEARRYHLGVNTTELTSTLKTYIDNYRYCLHEDARDKLVEHLRNNIVMQLAGNSFNHETCLTLPDNNQPQCRRVYWMPLLTSVVESLMSTLRVRITGPPEAYFVKADLDQLTTKSWWENTMTFQQAVVDYGNQMRNRASSGTPAADNQHGSNART